MILPAMLPHTPLCEDPWFHFGSPKLCPFPLTQYHPIILSLPRKYKSYLWKKARHLLCRSCRAWRYPGRCNRRWCLTGLAREPRAYRCCTQPQYCVWNLGKTKTEWLQSQGNKDESQGESALQDSEVLITFKYAVIFLSLLVIKCFHDIYLRWSWV